MYITNSYCQQNYKSYPEIKSSMIKLKAYFCISRCRNYVYVEMSIGVSRFAELVCSLQIVSLSKKFQNASEIIFDCNINDLNACRKISVSLTELVCSFKKVLTNTDLSNQCSVSYLEHLK